MHTNTIITFSVHKVMMGKQIVYSCIHIVSGKQIVYS